MCNNISKQDETVQATCVAIQSKLRLFGLMVPRNTARRHSQCRLLMNSFANREFLKRLIYDPSEAAGRMHERVTLSSTRV